MEVIDIQFEEMKEIGTLEDYLAECGFIRKNNMIHSNNKMIGLEEQTLQVA